MSLALLLAFATSSAIADASPQSASFDTRAEVAWPAAAQAGARCVVRVRVSADTSLGGVQFLSCPEALRAPVQAAVDASTFTAAYSRAGVAIAAPFRTTFTVPSHSAKLEDGA